MHLIYAASSITLPDQEPDSSENLAFLAAEDGKYEFIKGKLFRRQLLSDETEDKERMNGVLIVKSNTRWSRPQQVWRLPIAHTAISFRRRSWTLNKRLTLIEELFPQGTRCYFESTYDVSDPALGDLLRKHVRSSEK